jgi:hypothetical protein
VAKQMPQQQQHQRQEDGVFKLPSHLALYSITDVNSDAFKRLLPMICSVVVNVPLKPLQLDTRPRLSTLDEQERLALRGQKGFRVHDGAFACLNQFLAQFSKSQAMRESARGAHIPKNVSCREHWSLWSCMRRTSIRGGGEGAGRGSWQALLNGRLVDI